MSQIAIEVAMRHLRADGDDQDHVQLLLEAAEDSAAQYLDRRFYADSDAMAAAVLVDEAGTDPILINPSITAACLLILGHLYSNREDVVVGVVTSELPMGSRALLTPYRVGMGA